MEAEKKKRRVRLPVCVLACVLCLAVGASAALIGVRTMLGEDGVTILQAARIIQERFVGDYDRDAYRQAVLGAMVDDLGDRWSYYLTPEEYASVQDARRNAYVGIGITVDREEPDGLRILTVTKGGPAEEAGLLPGERIRAVEGTAVTPENRDACIELIRGEEGTAVTLTVEAADGTARTVEITRRTVQGISAVWSMLDGQVGLITIGNFYSGTAALVEEGLAELQAQGARALILDVRNDPGGYVTELTEILDALLPEGDVFISRSWDGSEKVYTSDAACVSLPLAVLVNADSYSAAEFLAAELRESAGAVIVGEQTSGKGYSQQLFALADGSAMGLSTARYFTGSGESLIGKGLTPDVPVALDEDQAQALLYGQLEPPDDPQLQAALHALAAAE